MIGDIFFASFQLPGILVYGLLIAVPAWRIFQRAGFEPYWSLLVFVPVVGWVLALGWLAFKDWPAVTPRRDE